jgi:hypothetical protein
MAYRELSAVIPSSHTSYGRSVAALQPDFIISASFLYGLPHRTGAKPQEMNIRPLDIKWRFGMKKVLSVVLSVTFLIAAML